MTKARELGFDTVACTSTGNLAASVAAHAAKAKIRAYVFVPSSVETGKLVASGAIKRGELMVAFITGAGPRTQEIVSDTVQHVNVQSTLKSARKVLSVLV